MIDLSFYARTLEKKAVAVFGLGLSGLATVEALLKAGLKVTAWDDKEENRSKAENLGAVLADLSKEDLSFFDFLVLSPGVPYLVNPHDVVLNARQYDLEIIGDVELLHRSGHGKKTIGITGTNGKSTTTALATHVFNEAGVKAVMGGNIGKPVLSLDLDDTVEVVVLEMSSYQIDLCPYFRPDVSVLLNITPDHLDRHGGMEGYVEAKAKIFDGSGVAVIGVDDDFSMAVFDDVFCKGERKVVPISVHTAIPEGIFVQNSVLKKNTAGHDSLIGRFTELETLKGIHNHQNAACVYAVAKEFGIDDEVILKAFLSYPGLPHRQYLVTESNNVSYINDSKATNAEAAAKALASYDNIFWIIGGISKEGGLSGLEIFKDKIKKTYVLGQASTEFATWLKDHNFDFVLCESLDNATEEAHEDAQNLRQGATVLLSPACASWDQFSSFEERGNCFSDVVLSLVEKV